MVIEAVIPAKAGIQFFSRVLWMPDQVRHDELGQTPMATVG